MWPEALENMMYVSRTLNLKNVQESFNDVLYYREEIQKAFKHGDITLRLPGDGPWEIIPDADAKAAWQASTADVTLAGVTAGESLLVRRLDLLLPQPKTY